MAHWYEVVAVLSKKIRDTRILLALWSAGLGFWSWQVVFADDPHWLDYAMTFFAVLFVIGYWRSLQRFKRLRHTAELMGRASPHRP